MKNRIPHTRVSTADFLKQPALRQGVIDSYGEHKFRSFKDPANAHAYERGRHLAAYAKTQKLKICKLYTGYLGGGEPTDKFQSVCAYMWREKFLV